MTTNRTEVQTQNSEADTLSHTGEHHLADLSGGVGMDEFKSLFRGHPGGVAVVTADDGTGPVAMTATSVSSVSAIPPLLAFSVSQLSSASTVITSASTVVVHLLTEGQLELGRLCATSGVDRFADQNSWERLSTGEPRYVGVPVWARGEVATKLDAGSATIMVVHVLESGRDDEAMNDAPLVYHDRTWHRLSRESVIDG